MNDSKVIDMGMSIDNSWTWDFGLIVAKLTDEENMELKELLDILHEVKPLPNIKDEFVWQRINKGFLIKSSYESLEELCYAENHVDECVLRSLDILWKTKVPGKGHLFGWNILINKLPTRTELTRRWSLKEVTTRYVPYVVTQK